MVGHTVVEIFGHIVYSFTRSVAERYSDFAGETEQNTPLIGYNPLDDTGLEWYSQPVDELIYQEYSDREATTFDYLPSSTVRARLINACSLEDNDESNQEVTEDRAMAWKRLRPSIFRSIWKSFYFGFLISVLSATIVGIVSIMIYYLNYQTLLKCEGYAMTSIPGKLQWMKTISEVIVSSVFFYWFFLNSLFFFRSFQISGLKLKLCLICLVFYSVDALRRISFQALEIKLTSMQNIPVLQFALLFLCVGLQVFLIVRHLCRGPRKTQCKFFVLITTPYVLIYVIAIIIPNLIYPAYRTEDKSGKMIIAIFAPLIALVVKVVSRVCVQQLTRISHPGTSFVLLVPLYCGAAVMLRLLQVDLGIDQKFESVVIIGVIHGIAEVVERSTMVLIDHITHQVLERRKVPWGGFRTPRRERLAADISILSMLYESTAIISVNGFLYLYQYFYTSDNSPLQLLQSFATTTSVPLAIEWFFTSVSIAIETRFQNMPIIAVWRKTWKWHLLVAVINAVVIAAWLSSGLIVIAVKGNSVGTRKDFCQMPFGL
ncbi:hypothetical protein ACROYT_G044412 [Oculina patagonica]